MVTWVARGRARIRAGFKSEHLYPMPKLSTTVLIIPSRKVGVCSSSIKVVMSKKVGP